MTDNMSSCDSYNTVQLQLINGNDSNSSSAGAIAAAAAAAASAASAAGTSSSALPQESVPVDEVMPASIVLRESSSENDADRPIRDGSGEQRAALSPYSIPQRAGRSVSSLIGNYFGTSPRIEAETPTSPSAVVVDDDNDSVDFWGGESPKDHSRDMVAIEDSESDDEDIDMVEGEDVDDLEEDDEEDHMEIFGHR